MKGRQAPTAYEVTASNPAGSSSAPVSLDVASDGSVWTAGTLPGASSWRSITYGNGLFVATTDGGGFAATSPDGVTWNFPQCGELDFCLWNSVLFLDSARISVILIGRGFL